MKNGEDSVSDGKKLTDEELGRLSRKFGEIQKRINQGVILYEDVICLLQDLVIEKGPNTHKLHLGVVKGTHEIKAIEHFIDCDADPFTPPGLSVEKHTKGGFWKWNPNISLYLSKKQRKGTVVGNDLRKELEKQLTLNANVLDWLLAHPELIPEEWKGKYIFFWGTIYCNSGRDLYVRYLYWCGKKWDQNYRSLNYYFVTYTLAALSR